MIAEVQKQIQCPSVLNIPLLLIFHKSRKFTSLNREKFPYIQMVTIIFCSSSKYSPLWPLHSQRIIFSFSLIFRKLKERDIPTVAQMVKNLPAMQETRVQFLGWEDPLEKGMAIHSSTLAWRSPWTEESGMLQAIYNPWGCKESDKTEQLTIYKTEGKGYISSHSVILSVILMPRNLRENKAAK